MIIITPRIDVDGERWIEPIEGLRLKVTSSENHQFRSRNAVVRRHIEKMDAHFKVGTTEFNPADVGDIDSIDDLLIDTAARFLLRDWEGVGEMVDGKEQAIEYTAERGVVLLKQHPELYWHVLSAAADIANGKAEQVKATVGKSSKRKSG